MKYASIIARILFGAAFLIFGLNFFLKFIPLPPPESPTAGAFLGALFTSGYLTVVKVLEIIGALLVLSGRYTALGLLILGPIVINIFLYHAFLDPKGLALPLVLNALAAFLLYVHRAAFAGIVKQS